jgi:hypothetical protein
VRSNDRSAQRNSSHAIFFSEGNDCRRRCQAEGYVSIYTHLFKNAFHGVEEALAAPDRSELFERTKQDADSMLAPGPAALSSKRLAGPGAR